MEGTEIVDELNTEVVDLESLLNENGEEILKELDRLGFAKKSDFEEQLTAKMTEFESQKSEFEKQIKTYNAKLRLVDEGFKVNQVDAIAKLLADYENEEEGIADLKNKFGAVKEVGAKKFVVKSKTAEKDFSKMTKEELRKLNAEDIAKCPADIYFRAWN